MEWTSTKRRSNPFGDKIKLKNLADDELENIADTINFERVFYANNRHYGEPATLEKLRNCQESYNFFRITEIANCDNPCCMLKHGYIEQLKHGWNNSRLASKYAEYDSVLYTLGWFFCDFSVLE